MRLWYNDIFMVLLDSTIRLKENIIVIHKNRHTWKSFMVPQYSDELAISSLVSTFFQTSESEKLSCSLMKIGFLKTRILKIGFSEIGFENRIWKLDLKIGFENWICKLDLKIGFENWVWKLDLKIGFEIWKSDLKRIWFHCYWTPELEIRFGNGCLKYQIWKWMPWELMGFKNLVWKLHLKVAFKSRI